MNKQAINTSASSAHRLECLTEAQKDALIRELLARIQVLEARVKELEGIQSKDSSNSGKPPSSDGLKKPPRANEKSLRRKSGKKVGGQVGHSGQTLEASETPDKVEEHNPCCCGRCGQELSDIAKGGYERRQVYDLPALKLEVTEHRAYYKVCPGCLSLNRGEFPAQVEYPVQYGPGVKSMAVYLHNYQLLPYERTGEVFADIFNHPLSVGTLLNAEETCYERLESISEAIRRALGLADVAHFDESGLRVEGKLHWLHSASTASLTWYQVHSRRGTEALEEAGILGGFKGIAVHDAWQSYFCYLCLHALCNAHHLRELKLMFEHYLQEWAAAMAALLRDIHRVVEHHRQKGENALSPAQIAAFEHCYDAILASALEEIPSLPDPPPDKRGKKKQHPAKNLYDRLSTHKQAVLRFMRDFRVPFDNNQAERDIRMIKAQQKISGAFRKFHGAQVFCRIRGYISTARKQGQKVLDVLRQVFAGTPWMPVLVGG